MQLTIVPPSKPEPSEFDRFWYAYPSKQNKGEALIAFLHTC